MPLTLHGLTATDIHANIRLLIHNLINIQDPTGQYLQRLPDGRVIDTKSWHGWEWTHGVALYGLWQYHALTGDEGTLGIVEAWFERQLGEGTTRNVNTMAPFLALAYLYEVTARRRYLPHLLSWADWAMHDLPRTPFGGFQHITYSDANVDELWDDTLMMAVLPLAKIGLLLNRPEYVEEAKRQFLTHIQFLFDPGTGLWFHGWKFSTSSSSSSDHDDSASSSESGVLGHNFARARWARGNAWVTIAIPEFVELLDLPPGDALRTHLLNVLEAQCAALKRLQGADGLWRTLLDVAESEGSYPEASATAGFAYGMLKAVRKRYIRREEYEGVAVKALEAVVGKIGGDGEVRGVSFGTAMGRDLQHYKDVPLTSMPYGQAMAVMALGEFLWLFT